MPNHPFLADDFHIRWSTLTPEHIEDDIQLALQRAKDNIASICDQPEESLSYESTFGALESASKDLEAGWGRLNHLDAVADNEAQRSALNTMLPEVSAFYASIHLNFALWEKLKAYSQNADLNALSPTKQRFVEETCLDFQQAGAELDNEKKLQLKNISAKLATLTQKFGENVLDSTNDFELILKDAHRLEGLPDMAIEAARQDALAQGHGSVDAPQWRFTLQFPSMMPIMQHAKDESLRREIWEASNTIGLSDQYDNTEIVWDILKLRHQKAEILGKDNFADLVLERRMAKDSASALSFVENLHGSISTQFQQEVSELLDYRNSHSSLQKSCLEPWETTYWAEQRRRETYDFDDEELRPYFQVDRVMSGMFELFSELFSLRIEQHQSYCGSQTDTIDAIPTWHGDTTFYDLYDANSEEHLGSFYADWHPRPSKRGGAWMNSLKTGLPPRPGHAREPHLGLIVGNMTKPLGDQPALLTHREVETIFHEFGHLLHHLLSDVEIESLAGTNVPWDFVELPSQILENFCWDRSSLDLFAKHHKTGDPIPEALFQKMIASRNYMSATAFMRQLAFCKLDLELHSHLSDYLQRDLDEVDKDILRHYRAESGTPSPSMSRRFSHLFSSPTGYAAGYYSYKWAEVLDADAYTKFKQSGVLNKETGMAFRREILSKGNSRPVQDSYRAFMGRDPELNPLLERSGLT